VIVFLETEFKFIWSW